MSMRNTRTKRSKLDRRAAPPKKELKRDQALALRARRAIESAAAAKPRERPRNLAVAAVFAAHAATKVVAPILKDAHHRNPRLLAMARDMPCLFRLPGICNRDPSTTVAAHSNWACHGKGMALKASDAYTCWACSTCHAWLDTSGAPKEARQHAFMAAHMDQVLLWRQIATDPARPEPDRKAARWALGHLNATPIGEAP